MPAPRWLRRVGLALLLLFVALAVGAVPAWRAFVREASATGRLEAWFNPRPERVQVTWRRLASPWPGRVEAEGLRVAGRTPRLAWEVTAEQVSGLISPAPLLRRRLVFTGVRGHGVTVRVTRFEAAAAAIAAGSEVPVVGGHTTPAPPPDLSRPPWSFAFTGVEVTDLREAWFDDRCLTGSINGRGGFEVRRRTFAEVFASRLDVRGGRLRIGDGEIAGELAGTARFRILPWRFRGARVVEVARRVEGQAVLRGEVTPDPALAHLFGSWPGLEIETAPGRFDADVGVRRATFTPGSRLDLDGAVRALRFLGFEAHGRAALSARIEGRWPGTARLGTTLRLDGWQLGRPEARPLLFGDGLLLEARTGLPRVDRRPEGAELEVDLGSARLPDLTFLDEMIPATAGLRVVGGSARLGGRLRFGVKRGEGPEFEGDGTLNLRADDVALRVGEDRWTGDLTADLHLSDPAFEPVSFALDGSRFVLNDLVVIDHDAGEKETVGRDWWGELSLPAGRIDFSQPAAARGRFTARLADSRPLVALYEMQRDLPAWVTRLLTVRGLSLGGDFDWRPGRLRLNDAVLSLARGEVRGNLYLGRETRRGRLLVSLGSLAAGVELTPEGRRLHLRQARAWWAEEATSP